MCSGLKVGFYVKWPISTTHNVIGDALLAEALCRMLQQRPDVSLAKVYAPDRAFDATLDVLIYLNDTLPFPDIARAHIIYLQNGYQESPKVLLDRLYSAGYDSYLFFSHRLLAMHKEFGREGLYLPFGAETDFFSPQPPKPEYSFDVSYVGNDIKGIERTMQYLYPAVDFNFGLFGNWQPPHISIKKPWENLRLLSLPAYKWKFPKISRGRIPQPDMPALYSSSKINLNCTLQSCVDWDVITLRTYEVLACKGFLITDNVPSLNDELKGGVVITTGGDDLRKKIAYYLEHEDERRQIAETGYAIVTKAATCRSRADLLVEYIKSVLHSV